MRKLFQTADNACKPNEEAAAAGRFLSKLIELADGAGGAAPLPNRPDTHHLLDLQSFAGNEQLLGILNRHDELIENIKEWRQACELSDKRLLVYKRLLVLLSHAGDLDIAKDMKPQVDAIAANRSLLDAMDPVPDLAKALADALRAALTQAEKHYAEIYDEEWQRLTRAESWQKIGQEDRDRILGQLHIKKVSKGATGTEQEVLDSLERISLDAWRTHTAALPQFFADARIRADKLIEPKTHPVKLGSAALHTPEEVKAWVEKTGQGLLEQIKKGLIIVN